MGIFFGWIIFSFIVGFIGTKRKIGFAGAFLLSLLLSPLIGLIITLVSKDKEAEQYKQRVLEVQQLQTEALKNFEGYRSPKSNQRPVIEELESLLKMKEAGHLTEIEYQKAKFKIIGQ